MVISDHHERRLGETAAELSALGLGRVEHVVCDVTSTAQVDALIDSTTARMGRLDVLVNNAGLGGQTPVADMTDDEWDRVLDVSLTSVFRATRAALRYFRDAPHGGVIVNNASVLGWRAQHSQSHYAAAKAGVMALTRCSAIEAAEYGVRINAVSPSIARHKFLDKTASAELLDRLAAKSRRKSRLSGARACLGPPRLWTALSRLTTYAGWSAKRSTSRWLPISAPHSRG